MLVFLYKTKCFCFFVSFSIISACRNKRKNFRSMRKCRIFFAERTLKNLSLVNFMNYTIRSNVYNLSCTWSFSTEQSVFVSSFPSLSYHHARTRENFSVLWKKYHISLHDGLWKISLSQFYELHKKIKRV